MKNIKTKKPKAYLDNYYNAAKTQIVSGDGQEDILGITFFEEGHHIKNASVNYLISQTHDLSYLFI